MSPVFDNQDYHKKMLELQEKLRQCEESRIRLEERFNLLEKESKIRHESCINKLRMRYIEFLEEQRVREERNSKLLGALERVDSGLAVMSAKTDKLCTLKKEYEASMVRTYLSRRQVGSVTGDSGIVSRNDDKISRKPFHTSPSFPSTTSLPPSPSPSTFPRLLSYPERLVIDHQSSKSIRDLDKNWYSAPRIEVSSFPETPSRNSKFLTKDTSPFQYPETVKPLRPSKLGSMFSSSNYDRNFGRTAENLGKFGSFYQNFGRNSNLMEEKAGNLVENELDEYINKIKSLHGDLDPSQEEIDVEQNTSGDLLNVSFSDDGVDQIPPEEKSRHVPAEVENVLKMAEDLAGRTINAENPDIKDRDKEKSVNFEEKIVNLVNGSENVTGNANSAGESIGFGDNTTGMLKSKIASNVDPNLASINERQPLTSAAPDKIKLIAPADTEIDQSANEISAPSTNPQAPIDSSSEEVVKEPLKLKNTETIASRVTSPTNLPASEHLELANHRYEPSVSNNQAISEYSGNSGHSKNGVAPGDVIETNFDDKSANNVRQDVRNSNSVSLASEESKLTDENHKNSSNDQENNENTANDQANGENYEAVAENYTNNEGNNEKENAEGQNQENLYPYPENYAYAVEGQGTEAEYAEMQYDQQNYDPNQQNYDASQQNYDPNDPNYASNIQYQANTYPEGAGEQYNQESYPDQQNIEYSAENYQPDANAQYLAGNYDPNNQNYDQNYDPNYDQQANQYNYEQQYEGEYPAEGQTYPATEQAYAENYGYQYDQNYQEYPAENQAEPETIGDSSAQEQSQEQLEEVSDVDKKAAKKKKDVIKSILDSETESSIEKNTEHTESDFDFN